MLHGHRNILWYKKPVGILFWATNTIPEYGKNYLGKLLLIGS